MMTSGGLLVDLKRDALERLAQLGARARLDELRREVDAIRRAFPDLFGRGRRRARAVRSSRGRRRKRGRMSAAARRAVSARMKKYWAARRKNKASK
jgi:hypothetical protein